MDAVYILGNGSLANNLELVQSIRLLRKHCLDLRNIFVVGANPPEGLDVIHIPASDNNREPWKNAWEKICIACRDERVSDDFILMNDDFFALSDFSIATLPFYAIRGASGGVNGMQSYFVHAPIRYNKEMFLSMPFNLGNPKGSSPRGFYCNFYKAKPEFIDDMIMRYGDRQPSFDDQIHGLDWFSTDDTIFTNEEFVKWITAL